MGLNCKDAQQQVVRAHLMCRGKLGPHCKDTQQQVLFTKCRGRMMRLHCRGRSTVKKS
jgi:hypothetical protein